MRAAPGIDPWRAGVGLRTPHYRDFQARETREEGLPRLGFLEVHSENYFGDGGAPLAWLEWFRARYPLSAHGVGLSLGSADPLDARHLARLKRLIDRFEPTLVSEHLCWSGIDGRMLNDLLPLPYTPEALDHLVSRVAEVQDFLGRRILVENVSSYLAFESSTIPEWEFVAALARRSGCGLLLDVNNIHVNSVNHRYDAATFLAGLPLDRVAYIHVAGHYDEAADLKIDTHGSAVIEPVWTLLARAYALCGPVPTLLERDFNFPPLAELHAEVERIQALQQAARVPAAAAR